jgi:hypothetical protein
MPFRSTSDFERFCKEKILYLDQRINYLRKQHEDKVAWNKEHADEIMDELSAYGSWMSDEEPGPGHWYPSEQDDLKEIYQYEAVVRKWRKVLQDTVKHLLQLDLSEMDMDSFPKDICELTYLTLFNIAGNKLLELPKEVGKLVNLVEFDLSNNQLTSLPAEIGMLINLSNLNLANNQLTSLPPTISKLSHLTSLDLSGNKFELPPDEIGELVNLKVLKV